MDLKLNKLKSFKGRSGPLLLIILDGVGLGNRDDSDGVFLAKTPCLDDLKKSSLYTTLKAHGTAVGMPSDEDMGNSEVGHNALGAGRIFDQGAKLVNRSIETGKIFEGDVWKELIKRASGSNDTFHFIGLLSDGNVHSHIDQLYVLLRQCAKEGIKRVRIHALQDGRDVYEKSALDYIKSTENILKELNEQNGSDYAIASGGGRMVTTMDRYNADWEIVKRGWEAHVLGRVRGFSSAREAIQIFYKEDPKRTDQYLPPWVVMRGKKAIGEIEDDDSVVFFNFRGDRAIEISQAFEEKDFDKFDRKRIPDVAYAGMMEYDGDRHIPKKFLVDPPQIDHSLGQYMCANKIFSFAISETQKYGHVTYFWNGNNSGYIDENLETYIEIPSDKVEFDKTPKMKAPEITSKAIELLKLGKYKFGRINFPNGDMVGHTGVRNAIIESVTCVDECTQKLIDTVNDLNGITIVLADHGNADEMFVMNKGEQQTSTAHSLNPVPFAIVDSGFNNEYELADLPAKGLANVAATMLNLLGFEAPKDYEPSLIKLKN